MRLFSEKQLFQVAYVKFHLYCTIEITFHVPILNKLELNKQIGIKKVKDEIDPLF